MIETQRPQATSRYCMGLAKGRRVAMKDNRYQSGREQWRSSYANYTPTHRSTTFLLPHTLHTLSEQDDQSQVTRQLSV
jgi:hypothetical protein